jgi:hypothetical protein
MLSLVCLIDFRLAPQDQYTTGTHGREMGIRSLTVATDCIGCATAPETRKSNLESLRKSPSFTRERACRRTRAMCPAAAGT